MFEYKGIRIRFQYGQEYDEHFGERRSTECIIEKSLKSPPEEKPIYKELARAKALCSMRDIFTKASGRKISLGRALRKAFPDYEFRVDFWSAYLEARPE